MKHVELYTTPWCPFCIQAKRLLDSLKIPYEDHDVSGDPQRREAAAQRAGGWPTVPMVFVGETFVGGYSELAALHQQGQLLPKVQGP